MSLRRAFVLPVVLVLIGLLALTMAGFMFFVRAEVAGAAAERDAYQARLTAESGLEELTVILRQSPGDVTVWFDDPNAFRHKLVWAANYRREDDPAEEARSRERILEATAPPEAWRFSIVGIDHDGVDEYSMRYGITPEASKLNINSATEDEIRRLLDSVLLDLQIENTAELADALLDWLDDDDEMRAAGAENDYYNNLNPGYFPKNGPLDTIEELLLVKGFSAAILYGEDVNRNGILDLNEDDGAESFPFYDDGDGILDMGLAPYITVWSREVKPQQNGNQNNPDGQGEGDPNDPNAAGDPNDPNQAGDPNDPNATPGSQQSGDVLTGRIHVNTAPARVLLALEGMTEEAAEQIIAYRREQPPEALESLDWLTTSGALDAGTFANIKDRLTTEAYQFHVEIVGYGDHTKVFARQEWIIELRGPAVQVLYHRDLTPLGLAWPVDDDTVVITD